MVCLLGEGYEMYELILFLQIVGVAISFTTLAVISHQKSSEHQKVLMMASFCGFISIIAYLFEIQATNLHEMMVCVRFGYIGKCYMLVLMLIFARNYCNVKMSPIIIRFVFLFNTFILLTILTSNYHTFYYKKTELSNDGYFPHVLLTKGLGYYLYMTVTFCMVAYYCSIIIAQIRRSENLEQKRLFLLLLSGILPTCMMVLYLTGYVDGVDLTPVGIIISCLLLVVNVIKLGLLDTMDVAKDNIIKQTSDGVLIVDSNQRLLYSNPAADIIAERLEDAHGITDFTSWIFSKSVNHFVFQIENRQYEAKITQLLDGDRQKGYVIWIYDQSYIDHSSEGLML